VTGQVAEIKRGSALLEVQAVSLTLGERALLSGVNLALREGHIHALIGSNGAGKSTLAYALMGSESYRPQSGEIRLRGQSILQLAMDDEQG
jgi:Fe-S cluster assembly ATP-binding protein